MPTWSEHDINILKEYYPKYESLGCIDKLEVKRSFQSISTKARKLRYIF